MSFSRACHIFFMSAGFIMSNGLYTLLIVCCCNLQFVVKFCFIFKLLIKYIESKMAEKLIVDVNKNEVQTQTAIPAKRESEFEYENQTNISRAKRFECLLQQTEMFNHVMSTEKSQSLSPPQRNVLKAKQNKELRRKSMYPSKPTNPTKASNNGPADIVTKFERSPFYIKNGEMRDYQVDGLNWLITLHAKGLSGILADEMGLGKTIQSISLLGYLKHVKNIRGPHLVIVPKATVSNWMNEFNKWCPSLKVLAFVGEKSERRALRLNSLMAENWNVCITTYNICIMEKLSLKKIDWHYLIIDEGHRIKNEQTVFAQYVRLFNTSNRLLLTGTPLHNNLHELWALLNFLLPDVFNSSEDFDVWFNRNSGLDSQESIERLKQVLRPLMLRRIKAVVCPSLLPKIIKKVYVTQTEMQLKWSKLVVSREIPNFDPYTAAYNKKRLFNIVMQLRKVAIHPYIFEGAEPQFQATNENIVTDCGKMIVLDKMLAELKKRGSRVLIFSQMVRMIDILDDYCVYRNYKTCRITGETSSVKMRSAEIDRFNAPNSDIFICLISTRAGGVGINLATADTVILYDSDWNPQMDLQAMDRSHRIGQTKQVRVYQLITKDTIEMRVSERGEEKLELDRMVIKSNNKEDFCDIIHLQCSSTVAESSCNNNSDIDAEIQEILK